MSDVRRRDEFPAISLLLFAFSSVLLNRRGQDLFGRVRRGCKTLAECGLRLRICGAADGHAKYDQKGRGEKTQDKELEFVHDVPSFRALIPTEDEPS